MPINLNDIAAVATEIEKKDILFQVNQHGEMTYWESNQQNESKQDQYTNKALKVNNAKIIVNKDKPLVAAVSYIQPTSATEGCGGQTQLRVYYVDRDALELRELAKKGDNGWEHGWNFNNHSYRITATSGISANVVVFNKETKEGQLKVYYDDGKSERTAVAYSPLGEGDWNGWGPIFPQ